MWLLDGFLIGYRNEKNENDKQSSFGLPLNRSQMNDDDFVYMTAEQLEEIIGPTVRQTSARKQFKAGEFNLVCDKCQKSERPWECKCLGNDKMTKEQLEEQLADYKRKMFLPKESPEPRYSGKSAKATRRADEQAKVERAARDIADIENAHKMLAKRVRSSATAMLLSELTK